jgi:mutator protein MutT
MMQTSRTYPAFPIPSVGAVVVQQGYVLLIQRGQPPAQGLWTLPGGVIEVGETPEEAVVREVREETNLTVTVGGIVEIVTKVFRDVHNAVQYHYLILDYLATCRAGAALPSVFLSPDADVTDVRWIPLGELSAYDLTDGVLPVIQRGIALQHANLSE